MKAILVNYNFDPKDWWLDYGIELDIMYDRSDDGVQRTFAAKEIRKTQNIGDVDYDKLGYLIEHYDSLPDTFLWAKTNLIGRFVAQSDFKKAIASNVFTPLLKFDHRTYSDRFGVVNRYSNIYEERADGWFFNNPALAKKCPSWEAWCTTFGLPKTQFIPFAPGGSYILTRERVHRYSKDLYQAMRDTLPYAQHPAEAHAAERSYYLLWR